MTNPLRFAALVAALAAGCDTRSGPDPFKFKDDVQTNVQVEADTFDLSFTDRDGNPVDLKSYRGKKNVVLVVTRGMTYPPDNFCMYCSGQTSRLIANYKEFTKRGAEVLLVIPGPKDKIDKFLKRAREQADDKEVPFPVLLDEDFRAVNRLGIRDQLAKPSTYILDKQGQVRFAYVGSTLTDRPSIKVMLQQLDAIPAS
jgi:peroxiredoxin